MCGTILGARDYPHVHDYIKRSGLRTRSGLLLVPKAMYTRGTTLSAREYFGCLGHHHAFNTTLRLGTAVALGIPFCARVQFTRAVLH